MDWYDLAIERLSNAPVCGYHDNTSPATEPTALAALALIGSGRVGESLPALEWLVECQSPDGSLGVRADQPTPRWPTSLACLAWKAHDRSRTEAPRFVRPLDRAVRWALTLRGETIQRTEDLGHNTLLVGWPWVEGTHSWLEPTALHVLALKACGQANHPRTREAVQLLLDRQLPDGGSNYGNTQVLGQVLRPRVQPTGIAMLALNGEQEQPDVILRSLDYLERSLPTTTTAASLAWALLALLAYERTNPAASKMLEQVGERTCRPGASPHRLALLALARQGRDSPLISLLTV